MNWPRRKTRRTRPRWRDIDWLFRGALVAVGLAILSLGAIFLAKQRQDFHQAADVQMALVARLKTYQIAAWRDDRLNDLRQILDSTAPLEAMRNFLGAPGSGPNRDLILSWFSAMQRKSTYERALLLDAQFRALISLPGDFRSVDLPGLIQFYRQNPPARGPQADFRYDANSRSVKMEFLAPIPGPARMESTAKTAGAAAPSGNPPLGYVLLQVDPYRQFYPLTQSWPGKSQTAEIWLGRREGNSLLCLNELRFHTNSPLRLRLLLPTDVLAPLLASGGAEVAGNFPDYRQVPVLAAIRSVPQSNWYLVAKADESEIYRPWRARMGVALMLGILTTAGSALMVTMFWRKKEASITQKELDAARDRRALNQRLILLTKQANDMIFLTDRDWQILEANDRAIDSYEYSLGELRGMSFRNLWPPEDRESFAQQIARLNLADGVILEALHQRKVGPPLPVECSMREAWIDGNLFYQIMVRNVAERRQREHAIRRTQRLYAVLSQVNQTMVWTKSREQLFQKVCQIAVDSGDLKLALIAWQVSSPPRLRPVAHYGQNQRFIEELLGEHPPVDDDPLLVALENAKPWICNDLKRESVHLFWRDWALVCGLRAAAVFPIHAGSAVGGGLILFAAEPDFFSDAESRLLEEVALAISFALNMLEQEIRRQRAEEELQLFFDTALDMLCLAGLDGHFKKLSPAWAKTLGWTPAELLEKSFVDLVHPEDRARAEEWLQTLGKGRNIVNFECRFQCHDGSPRWLAWNAIGHLERQLIIAAARDITERKQIEEQLRRYAAELKQSNDDVKQFAYIVSHDLRAPLVNLRGFTAELKSAVDTIETLISGNTIQLSPPQRQALETVFKQDVPESLRFIDSAVSHMDSFVTALLKLSRLGHRELQPDRIPMNELVAKALQALAHQIKEHPATVSVGDLPDMIADRTAMEQIIDNLLGNAVKYLEPGRPGRIDITGEWGPLNARLQIRDNGRGIAAQEMDKVFAPFRRAGRQDVPGEGMGLAYVQMLVRRHGGNIDCASELGVGTTFSFTLPHQSILAAPSPPPANPAQEMP